MLSLITYHKDLAWHQSVCLLVQRNDCVVVDESITVKPNFSPQSSSQPEIYLKDNCTQRSLGWVRRSDRSKIKEQWFVCSKYTSTTPWRTALMNQFHTKLHSYVAYSFSGRLRIPASPCQSQLLSLNATRYQTFFQIVFGLTRTRFLMDKSERSRTHEKEGKCKKDISWYRRWV